MKKYTEEKIEMLRKMYSDFYASEISETMGVSIRSVYNKAHELGLKKGEKYFKRIGYKLSESGKKSRFTKGFTPVNKGKKIEEYMSDPDICSKRLKAKAGINSLRGIDASEAPRGTLFHDYEVDDAGLIKKVNLIIATGQNNLAMNRTIEQIARHFIHSHGATIPEGMLNRVEAGIRAYDPCLSCSTHAFGKMPMEIALVDKSGNIIERKSR